MGRRVHLSVPQRSHDRSNAAIAAARGMVAPACIPQIVLWPGYRYVLGEDPAVVTCESCRESWEFQQRVRQVQQDEAEGWLRRQLATLAPR
jgi:hypothetical protein